MPTIPDSVVHELTSLREQLAAKDAEIERLTAERDKLQAFKDWCHDYLDSKGVPYHPPGTHGAAGCRIGDRLDWVIEKFDALAADYRKLREVAEDLLFNFPDLSEIIGGQSTKAAESLIRKARAALADDAAALAVLSEGVK